MANIEVHRDGNRQAAMQAPEPRYEPLRIMRDLLGWDPFQEIRPLVSPFAQTFVPMFEIKETKDAYVFKADLPGVKESDLDVTVTGQRLAISGRREADKEDKSDTYYSCERSYGEFTRSFTLPDGVDMGSVQASLSEGVLSVFVKKAPEAQPKKIAVQTSGSAPKKS